jgi:penicillin-binding protein 2
MTVVDAIAQSNDIWMATVVAGSGSVKGMGIDTLARYANQFGLGRQLGIDLPFEQKGLIPTTQWKKDNFDAPDEQQWYTADSLFAAIGNGFDAATPLQMASVTAAVANGGTLMVPHIGKAIVDAQGNVVKSIDPQVLNNVHVDPQNLEIVRQGMRKGVIQGSSVAGNLHEVQVAGKTGTAEFTVLGPDGKPILDKNGHNPTNAWWVAFAPYNNPQVAVAVWVHDAGEGAAFAIPVGRKILARYFGVSDLRNPYGRVRTTPATLAGPKLAARYTPTRFSARASPRTSTTHRSRGPRMRRSRAPARRCRPDPRRLPPEHDRQDLEPLAAFRLRAAGVRRPADGVRHPDGLQRHAG